MNEQLKPIYRHLHENAELSGTEAATQRYILDKLAELGIETLTYEGQNAVVGIIRGGKPGKTIALRADMDALPIAEKTGLPFKSKTEGVMHACGHDAHMAIALGAAMLLNKNRANLHGNVKLVFEPQEETKGGGRDMVAAGCLENPKVDAVIGLHMNPDFPLGTVYTKPEAVSGGSTDIRIEICGKACHGAYPERGVDAILVGAQVVMALQSLVSRNLSPFDSAALSIGQIEGGSAANVVCETLRLHGTLRTLSKQTEAFMRTRIEEVVNGVCAANRATAKVVFRDSYQSLYNDLDLHRILEACADKEKLVIRPFPSLGVESFSFFIQNTPGLYYDLGCGKGTPIHTDTFQIDEDVLKIGAELQAAIATKFLNGGECK